MVRLFIFLALVTGAALAISQYADSPGNVAVTWLGYEIETSVFAAILALALLLALAVLLWSALRYVVTRPAALSRYFRHRQEERGLEALSQGLIAVGAGDKDQATRYAALARKRLPNEPLTGLLRAQTAQLGGDRAEARRIFEAMATQPQTELLGLRGLFLEARREEELEAARQFAERAMARNPDLAWSVNALFELQCRAGDWDGALKTLAVAKRQKQIDRETADRRRAVLLTAQARESEDTDTERALTLALEANKLAPDLVPAAELAGRLLVSKGSISRAGRLLSSTWKQSPHPDLALAYAYLRHGDSPRDRLKRVADLAGALPNEPESRIALATAAIEARAWQEARDALAPLAAGSPPSRVCTLMARIEGGERGDQGRVREWLARAVRAPRDPAWTADGYVANEWAPLSPVTGALDAFEWKVPVESIGPPDTGPDFRESMVAELAAEPIDPSASDGSGEPATEGQNGGSLVVEAIPVDLAHDSEPPDNAAETKQDEEPETVETAPPPGDGPPPRSAEEKRAAADEPDIFVPARAPDDPGPEGPSSELVEQDTVYETEKG